LLAHTMEASEKFPAEGPDHFRRHLENIRALAKQSPGELSLWASIEQYGKELQYSLDQEKVTAEEVEGFRTGITSFMSEGQNRNNYTAFVGEKATFWWEKGEGEPREKTP